VRQLSILAALIAFSAPAIAQQTARPSGAASSGEPSVSTTINLNVESGKLPFCFWASAMYSPGSHLEAFDPAKKTTVCFHCNADGTWDAPCQ